MIMTVLMIIQIYCIANALFLFFAFTKYSNCCHDHCIAFHPGKKYHNNPECSKMRSPREIDLLEAIQMGYEPCGKCKP